MWRGKQEEGCRGTRRRVGGQAPSASRVLLALAALVPQASGAAAASTSTAARLAPFISQFPASCLTSAPGAQAAGIGGGRRRMCGASAMSKRPITEDTTVGARRRASWTRTTCWPRSSTRPSGPSTPGLPARMATPASRTTGLRCGARGEASPRASLGRCLRRSKTSRAAAPGRHPRAPCAQTAAPSPLPHSTTTMARTESRPCWRAAGQG